MKNTKNKKQSFYWMFIVIITITFGYFTWFRYRQLYPPYSNELMAVLYMAGDNRKQLERVLEHYGRYPADSLKLRAAEFLIINMPGKYSEYYDAPWEDIAAVCMRWTSSSDKKRVLDVYGLGKRIIKEDIACITAEYLINNIELAFKVWKEQPWGKHITFDIFCEEILPYRISTEPLENWREKALASFADINRSLREEPNTTAVEACSRVNSLLPRFRLDKDFPPMTYSMLMASTRSTCDGMTAMAAFVMRALGIPVTIDFTPQWLNNNTGHTWNSVCDSAGRHISFMGTESNPGQRHQGNTLIKGKTYRKTYAIHNHFTNVSKNDIPPFFRNSNMKDISREHVNCVDIDIPLRFQPANRGNDHIYLAAMGIDQWNIVDCGKIKDQTISFASIGTNILYLPVYYKNNEQTPASFPFLIDSKGGITFFESGITDIRMLNDSVGFFPDETWLTKMKPEIFENIAPKGLWLFDNPAHIGKATIGHDLILCGTDFSSVAGKNPKDKAIRVGVGSYLKCFHGFTGNGGGIKVNEFTIRVDFKIPLMGLTYPVFQTNPQNDDYPECLITPAGSIGLFIYSAVTIKPEVWYQLTVSAGPERYDFYVDGKLIHQITRPIDDRYSLLPDVVLFFAGNDDYDHEFDISEVAIWDRALNVSTSLY
jgi:hypothetical protein